MTAIIAWVAWACVCVVLGVLWRRAWTQSAGLPNVLKWHRVIRLGVAVTVVGMTLFGIVIGVMA